MGSKGAESASFAIQVVDEVSGPSKDAAAALEQLQAKIDADTRALREMRGAMRRLKGGTTVNATAFRDLTDRIAAQKTKLAEAQASYVELGGTFGNTAKKADVASGGMDKLAGAAGGLPGPLGAMEAKLSGLASLLAGGGAIAAGMLVIVTASAALVSAVASATAALLQYGLAQSDAARSERLRLEGLTSIRRWYGLAAGSAQEMQAAMDRVNDSTGVGRGQLERYTEQLHRMGLRGANLTQALEGMAIVGTVQGDRMANRFASMAAHAARAGGSVEGLAESVRSRLGGMARRHMLSLDNQSARLRANLERMFGGLRIEGFLSALNEITRMLSQSSAAGRGLKAAIESVFQPMLDSAEQLQPFARRFFQGLTLGALLLAIGIVRVRNVMSEAFGDTSILSGINAQRLALYAGVAVFGLLTAAVVTATAVLAGMGTALATMAVTTAAFVAGVTAAYRALTGLGDAFEDALARARATDWAALGTSLVDGLVGGIQSGAQRVVGTVQNLANTARSALADALQIRSPSRVFASLGMEISRGVAVGVDSEADTVDRSVARVVDPPAARGARGAGGSSISIGDIHVHGAGDQDGRSIAGDIYDELVRLLEGGELQAGAA